MSSLPIGLLPHHGIKPYTIMWHHCPSGFSLIMASSHTQPCVITAHRASSSSWHQVIHHHVSSLPIGLLPPPHHGTEPYTTMCHHCPSCFSLIMASSHTQPCVITAHRASSSAWHQAIHHQVSSLPIGLLSHHGIKPYTTMCHHCPSGFFLIMAPSHTHHRPSGFSLIMAPSHTHHRPSGCSLIMALSHTHHRPSGFSLPLIMASSHTQSGILIAHRASSSSWHQAIRNHVSSLPIRLLTHSVITHIHTYTLNNGMVVYPFIHHTRPFPIACMMSSRG